MSSAPRRYAKALFGIAREDGTVAETGRELAALDQLLEANPALRGALFRPLFPLEQRRAVLRKVAERLGAGETLRRFVPVLA